MNLAAAELSRLMAYLDNQDLWYELFQAGVGDAPSWVVEVLTSLARFTRAMSTLHNYSLLEVSEGRHSVHTCVHDWTLDYLNHQLNAERCGIAIHCVAASVSWESEADYWVRNRLVLPHARRFRHVRFNGLIGCSQTEPEDLLSLAALYNQNDLNMEAEEMYMRVLRGSEKAWGPEHTSTLGTVNNLANLYADQGKMVEAEEMYVRALRGYQKTVGNDRPTTQKIARNPQALQARK